MSFNLMAAVPICSDFGSQENKICHCFHCFPQLFAMKDGAGCHDHSFLNVEFEVICISEVIDISPGNLDSSLCFIQPSILHDVLCI